MIREIKPEDIEKVAELSQKFFPYTAFSSPQMIENRILGNEAKFFVFLQDGKIIGFIDIDFTNKIPRLLGIAIEEKSRQKGIATKLIEHTIKFLVEQGFKEFDLLVKVSNKPAISLYEKFGFKFEKIHEQKIENEDVLIMKKEF